MRPLACARVDMQRAPPLDLELPRVAVLVREMSRSQRFTPQYFDQSHSAPDVAPSVLHPLRRLYDCLSVCMYICLCVRVLTVCVTVHVYPRSGHICYVCYMFSLINLRVAWALAQVVILSAWKILRVCHSCVHTH